MADPRRPAFVPPPVPPGWETLAGPLPVALWAAVHPEHPERPGLFRSNLVLTCDDLGGMSFRDWQAGTDEVLRRTLADYLLVDLERLQVDGRPGGRRLAHHVDDAGRALTMEQWFTQDGDRGWTLTATVDTWFYDGVADDLAGVAATWRPITGTRVGPARSGDDVG